MRKILVFGFLLLIFGQAVAQESIHLWEGLKVSHGKQVTLTPYLAENNPSGLSVIVCPGGSYYWLDVDTEGDGVARWLQSNGISAFVLQYRAAGIGAFIWHHRILFRGKQYPDMITDAQRAIQWVREHAKEYQIDPQKLGMMGFSAGGHLVMSTACFGDNDYLKAVGINTDVELKPAFVVPVYPVVTMRKPFVHKRSRRALLSERRNHQQMMIDSLSLECHIPADCPPVFLINCVDDPVVDYHNSMLLDSALTANKVTHRYIQYQTGGHGFGASEEKGTEECRQWKGEFLKWIKEIKL